MAAGAAGPVTRACVAMCMCRQGAHGNVALSSCRGTSCHTQPQLSKSPLPLLSKAEVEVKPSNAEKPTTSRLSPAVSFHSCASHMAPIPPALTCG
mmetsp:Transcript_1896/g.3573  ORF Transcript_1896/g.3573 Transcript_1896/m.3573 type:complete len:95 (-) Transcript_1896:112-396(-)